MTLDKSVVANFTSMSLDERFTQLRRADPRLVSRGRQDGGPELEHHASAKSRRLALQMSRRPAVLAALSGVRGQGVRRGSYGGAGELPRGRRGAFVGGRGIRGGLRGRSSFRGQNRLRGGSESVGRLSRSQSVTSFNGGRARSRSPFPGRTARSRSPFPGRAARSRSPFPANRGGARSRSRSRSRFNLRGNLGGVARGGFVQRRNGWVLRRGAGGGRGTFRGRGTLTFRRGGGRGRGGLRRAGGRGRGGRGGGRGGGGAPPSKEALDKELDQYMASSRATLDKEIDCYMSQTPGQEEEKWD